MRQPPFTNPLVVSRFMVSVGLRLLLFLPLCLLTCSSTTQAKHSRVSAVKHIFIVVMENKDQSEIAGNPRAPFLNKIIKQYGFATHYYGITHPSLPNYVAMIAGDTFGASSDDPSQRFSAHNLADQLGAHKRRWKAYMEDLPSAGFLGDSAPPAYAIRHDPFLLMTDIRNNPARAKHVVPLTRLQHDLVGNRAPSLLFIVPDLCHDMHGDPSCPSNSPDALISAGDSFVSGLISDIMGSSAWTGNSAIFVVWDESEIGSTAGCCAGPSYGGGLVPAIVIARQGARHDRSNAPYNHYSLLRTIESVWGLGCLAQTCNSAVKPMTEFLQKHH